MRTKTKNMLVNAITYPELDSEFDVQVEVWKRLSQMGFDVRGEVKAVCEDGGKRHKAFLDIVVFSPERTAMVVVECKNAVKSRHQSVYGRQARRYSKFGVPLVLCSNRSQIDKAVQDVINHIGKRSP